MEHIYLCGKYCNDLAMRLSFTDVPQDKIVVMEDIEKVCQTIAQNGDEQLYAVTCFSDRMKFLSCVNVK